MLLLAHRHDCEVVYLRTCCTQEFKILAAVATLEMTLRLVQVAGFWTSDEGMAAALTQASRRAGEKVWRMPLEEAYWEQVRPRNPVCMEMPLKLRVLPDSQLSAACCHAGLHGALALYIRVVTLLDIGAHGRSIHACFA